ncbi:14479_t:CDS:2, partial [Acaulospora morrowiae]
NGTQDEKDHMTVDTCLAYCSKQNYKYAGLEVATQCFCGNYYDAFTALSSEDCGSSCGGNNSQICGGPLALSIYEVPPNPVSSNSSSSLSTGAIIGISVGSVIFISLIFILIFKRKWLKRKIEKFRQFIDNIINNRQEETNRDLVERDPQNLAGEPQNLVLGK